MGRDPAQALWEAVGASGALVFTIWVDGRPAGIFGACPTTEPDMGAAWMLGTDRLLGCAVELMREAPRWIDFLHRVYPTLTNYVDERNEISIGWLEAMGFEFPYVDDYVTEAGITFRRFYRCATPRP